MPVLRSLAQKAKRKRRLFRQAKSQNRCSQGCGAKHHPGAAQAKA
jgi:hypothetical protein